MNADLVLALCEAFDEWDGEGDGMQVIARVPDATLEELNAHRAILEAEEAILAMRQKCAQAVYLMTVDAMVFDGGNVGDILATFPQALRWRVMALCDAIGDIEVAAAQEDP